MAAKVIVISTVSGAPTTYTVTVDSSTGILVNDHVSDSAGHVYRVSAISGVSLTLADDVSPLAPVGAPITGPGAAYTPTANFKLSQAPRDTIAWDEIIRRDLQTLDIGIGAKLATTAPVTYYVETTGSDSNPGTLAQPFLTIQAAINTLPKTLLHRVTINVGVGNFMGAVIDGFDTRIPTNVATDYSGLEIRGTLVNATLSQGNVSGTISAYTAASAGAPAVITDAAQNWAVNELKGKLITLTSGTGFPGTETTPPILVVVSNTATTATVVGPTTATGAAYIVQDFGTNINNAVSPAASTGSIPGQQLAKSGIFIGSSNKGGFIGLSRLKVTAGTNVPQAIRGMSSSGVRMVACRFVGNNSEGVTGILNMASVAPLGGSDMGQLVVSQCSVLVPNNCSGVILGSSPLQHQVINSFIEGGSPTFATGLALSGELKAALQNSYLMGLVNGIQFSRGMTGGVLVIATTINGNNVAGSIGINCPNTTTTLALPGASFNLTNTIITNCAGAAIQLQTPGSIGWYISGSGTGNAVGYNLSHGASMRVGSGVTLTGTTEVNIDGSSSTLAIMRGTNPKLLSTSFGTKLYE